MSEADDLREDFVREFKVLAEDGTLVPLTTTAYLSVLLSAVQLASRHPEAMATAPMQVAVEMARHIQTLLIATTPALKRVAEMGRAPDA